jgi:hypothetical protein
LRWIHTLACHAIGYTKMIGWHYLSKLLSLSRYTKVIPGNDTIDRYPLCASGAVKILCVTPKVWGEIYKSVEVFRRLIKGPAPRKVLEQAPRTKAKGVLKNECHAAYEPTQAICCNDADWRRWIRVKEWFNEYPTETAEKTNGSNEKGHIIELLRS